MLHRLTIGNYVLVDSLETEFPGGLVIMTGQTGAGKSLLVGALSLLLGAKADASVLSDPGKNCVVEGVFDLPDIPSLPEECEFEPDGELITVRRVIAPSGRSRAFVNDCPVAVGALQQLAAHLVDIHAQADTARLSDKSYRLDMLDRYAGSAALLAEYGEAYSATRKIRQQLDGLKEEARRLDADREYDAARYRTLAEAALRQGEAEELEAEEKLLANAEEIKSGLCRIESLYDSPEGEGIDTLLREVEKQLGKTAGYVPSLESYTERLSSVRIELDDIVSDIASLNASMDVSEDRLEAVRERLSTLYELRRRFGVTTDEELIAIRDELAARVGGGEDLADRIVALERSLKQSQAREDELAAKLQSARATAAPSFAEAVSTLLRGLELERAVFSVSLQPAPSGPSGRDEAVFRFSATGVDPEDMSKVASGGERSRIMLSLRAMMSRYMQLPTLIFDEIDTGVSGSAADKMGSLICKMGDNMQIFAITHLPQVAAKGRAHYLVSKTLEGDRALTSIRRIDGEERVGEIARMLSGSAITPEAVANARRLLEI